MTLKQALAALAGAGTARNRKVYARHGVKGAMFGVSYAELNRLRKAIGQDHELAVALWETGNHDARVLACMVADAGAMTARRLDAWARDLDNYVLSDAFSALVARGPHARRKAEAWKNRRGEWVSASAWNVMGSLALNDEGLEDGYCEEQIRIIAAEIHDRPNRTRHSMNNALIAFGVRNPRLEKAARAAARWVGPVAVDHGETGCRTPDADAYITKTLAHQKKRKRC